MRKLLFASVATAALGIAYGPAQATLFDVDTAYASALSMNVGNVGGFNGSLVTNDTARMTDSVRANSGVTQAAQNAGAGSVIQNSVALAAVESVRAGGFLTREEAGAYATSVNTGTVASGNVSIGGSATAVMGSSVNDNTGVTQAAQNAGAGSLLQNSASLASVTFCDTCPDVDLSVAVAQSGNFGSSTGFTLSGLHNATASMGNSVVGNQGLTQVAQNAGAGSLLQNSIAVGALLAPR